MIDIEKCYDNSQLSQYQKCPMSYYLQYVVGLRKILLDDSNASMNFGSAAHSFLEQYYRGAGMPSREPIRSYVEPKGMPQYSKEALELFCNTYNQKYTHTEFEVLEVEKVSYLPLEEYTFIIKRDGAIKHNGKIYGLEHKTTKSIGTNYYDKFTLSSQISAQCFDVAEKYRQCSGVLLNVGEIKCLKRKPSRAYDGVKQIEGGYLCCDFQRSYCNRTQQQLKDWRQNTISWIDEIETIKKVNVWKKATGSIGGYTCCGCEYKELCMASVGTNLDEGAIEMGYVKVDDPYEYLRGGE